MVKKAQEGTELRKGQYKRVGRISEKNPERAQRVADRMNTRASRVERGKEIANPSIMTQNPMYDLDRRMEKGDIRMKLKDKETMKMGGKLKPVDKTKKPGLAKLPTAVRNKMGFKEMGGPVKKCKYGCK